MRTVVVTVSQEGCDCTGEDTGRLMRMSPGMGHCSHGEQLERLRFFLGGVVGVGTEEADGGID